MSPELAGRPRRARGACTLVAALVAAGTVAGCVPDGRSGRSPGAARAAAPTPVSAWAVNDGTLSVVVRNTGARQIESARAVITARDRFGDAVATLSGPASVGCCVIRALPPGRRFGLSIAVGPGAVRVRSVSVRYADLVTTGATASRPAVEVSDVSLQTDGRSTVVRATLRTARAEAITTQAFLTGVGGRLVAVLAGPRGCVPGGAGRRVTLTSTHPVPAGTVVRSIEVLASSPDAATRCPTAG